MTHPITVTKIRDMEGWTGNATLYQLSDPILYSGGKATTYVIISAVIVRPSGPETYIFPASSEGKVLDWTEFDGSLRGTLSHKDAIQAAGWSCK